MARLPPVDPIHHLAHPDAPLDPGVELLRLGEAASPVEDGPAEPVLGFAGDHLAGAAVEALQLEVVEAAVDVAELGSAFGAQEGGADDAVAAGVGVPAHGQRADDVPLLEIEPGAGEVVDGGFARRGQAAEGEALAAAKGSPPDAADRRIVQQP